MGLDIWLTDNLKNPPREADAAASVRLRIRNATPPKSELWRLEGDDGPTGTQRVAMRRWLEEHMPPGVAVRLEWLDGTGHSLTSRKVPNTHPEPTRMDTRTPSATPSPTPSRTRTVVDTTSSPVEEMPRVPDQLARTVDAITSDETASPIVKLLASLWLSERDRTRQLDADKQHISLRALDHAHGMAHDAMNHAEQMSSQAVAHGRTLRDVAEAPAEMAAVMAGRAFGYADLAADARVAEATAEAGTGTGETSTAEPKDPLTSRLDAGTTMLREARETMNSQVTKGIVSRLKKGELPKEFSDALAALSEEEKAGLLLKVGAAMRPAPNP